MNKKLLYKEKKVRESRYTRYELWIRNRICEHQQAYLKETLPSGKFPLIGAFGPSPLGSRSFFPASHFRISPEHLHLHYSLNLAWVKMQISSFEVFFSLQRRQLRMFQTSRQKILDIKISKASREISQTIFQMHIYLQIFHWMK